MIDLHNEIQQKEAVYNWREDMIGLFAVSIIKDDEVHI
jgi:hypothetical protein